ncbi:MAG: 2-octaprenyl-6-methoxyphenyl hydroxylase [Gammaproteobacteria bacterium]|nr:2-octaprenyl-6-methoxyphenyl hydroxylase [Gammaproteobacteria bacterium]
MNQRSYDILIAGGGMAGASLALALRGYRGRIAVLDQQFATQAPAPLDVRSTALNAGSRRFFESLGLWQRVSEFAAPIRHIHVSDRGHFGAARLHAEEYALSALGYVAENHHLHALLAESLAAADNIASVDATVTGVGDDDSGDSLKVFAGDRAFQTRLLVVAAGARAALAARLGLRSRERSYAQAAIVANVMVARPREGVAFERFTETGPVALLPLGDARYAVVMTVAEAQRDTLLRCSDCDFLQRLQAAFGWRLGRFKRVGQRAAFPLSLVQTQCQIARRSVLVGNAARTLHPVAGQGLNLALRDVAELARLLHSERGMRDPGCAALLEEFAVRRRADQRSTTATTDLLVKTFGSRFAPVVVARNAGLIAMDLLPPLRHWFARRSMGLGARSPMTGLGGTP